MKRFIAIIILTIFLIQTSAVSGTYSKIASPPDDCSKTREFDTPINNLINFPGLYMDGLQEPDGSYTYFAISNPYPYQNKFHFIRHYCNSKIKVKTQTDLTTDQLLYSYVDLIKGQKGTYYAFLDYFSGSAKLIKLDYKGNVIWEKMYQNMTATEMVFDDGIIITGKSVENQKDIITLMKIDINGNKIWKRTYGTPSTVTNAFSVEKTKEGYVILGVNANPMQHSIILWTDKYGFETHRIQKEERSRGKALYAQGPIVITANILNAQPELIDINYYKDKKLIWNKKIKSDFRLVPVYSSKIIKSGNHYVISYSNSKGNTHLLLFNDNGDILKKVKINRFMSRDINERTGGVLLTGSSGGLFRSISLSI